MFLTTIRLPCLSKSRSLVPIVTLEIGPLTPIIYTVSIMIASFPSEPAVQLPSSTVLFKY